MLASKPLAYGKTLGSKAWGKAVLKDRIAAHCKAAARYREQRRDNHYLRAGIQQPIS